MKPVRLHRRAVLKGLGSGLALPLLDAMVNDRGLLHGAAHAQGGRPPVRFVGIPLTDGVEPALWKPKTVGAGYELTPSLMPIEKLRSDFNVISGLHQRWSNVRSLNPHPAGSIGGFVGSTGIYDTAANRFYATGPSINWVLGKALGKTKFPALDFVLPRSRALRHDCIGTMWSDAKVRAAIIDRPQQMFEKLFPSMPGAPPVTMMGVDPAADRLRRRRSLLDFVTNDTMRLHARLGVEDRARLDRHLNSVRELERQMNTAIPPATAQGCSQGPPKVGADLPPDDVCYQLMAKFVAYAFRCDLTRYMMAAIGRVERPDGLPSKFDVDDDHGASHNGPTGLILKYIQKKMELTGFLLKELKETPEGDSNLLYNSIVVCNHDINIGNKHRFDDMPILQAGNAGGQIKTGRHLAYNDLTLNALWISVLNMAGLPTETFGADGTAPLTGLSG